MKPYAPWYATLVFAWLLPIACAQPVSESAAPSAAVVHQEPCAFGSYEEQAKFTRRFYTRQEYEYARSGQRTECSRITYLSAGLRVIGYLVRPRPAGASRIPVIIFNRGGFLDMGKIEAFNLVDFTRLAEAGFVVLASQYRGNDGGEGREQVGGSDLEDVTNLVEIAKTLPYADATNVFMYGVSRGGMMTFLAIKRNVPIRAAAVVGAVYDLTAFQSRAPKIIAEAVKLIPDYRERGIAVLQERSAMNWPEAIHTPLLILHGTEDEEVPVTEALAFAAKFSLLHKPFELFVYYGDVHEVAVNKLDRDARVIAWFKRFVR
jgi:dipeptidyl aminopeptidase/acylaminoacyl peptidase